MQTVVIWGAASGLGAAMVEHFCALGNKVIGVARKPEKNPRLQELGVTTISCDATSEEQVNAAVEQLPAGSINISTMGSFMAPVPVDYIGHRHLINALEKHQLQRFFLVTSLGCGDSWQYLSEAARKGFGSAVREKSLAEAWLASSSLDYTILRPGGLRDGEATKQGQLSQNIEVHGVIYRLEVARLVEQLLNDTSSLGQIYACVDPSIKL